VIPFLSNLVVDRLWALGSLIAIGKSRQELSAVGAAPEYLFGLNWRDCVLVLSTNAPG
jgi:hypothetical protein